MSRAVLEKFPKSVLIGFILKRFWIQLGKASKLEAELLFYQYEQEPEAAMKECDEALAESNKHDYSSPEYKATIKRWEHGNERYLRAELLYARYRKMQGC